MRRRLVLLLCCLPLAASAKPIVTIYGSESKLADDIICPQACADGDRVLLERARTLAKKLEGRDVRFVPLAAYRRDLAVIIGLYADAARAYDAIACCNPTAVSVIALCERGHLADAYRRVFELLPMYAKSLKMARLIDATNDHSRMLREAICAFRAAAALGKKLGSQSKELRDAARAQRADEALLEAKILGAGKDPHLDQATLMCPEDLSQLTSMY